MGKNCDICFYLCMMKLCMYGLCVENGSEY